MRDARPGSSSAACPAIAESATHSFNRARMSGRHKKSDFGLGDFVLVIRTKVRHSSARVRNTPEGIAKFPYEKT